MQIFGLNIDLDLHDEVIIDAAEQRAYVTGIRLDSIDGVVEYLVEFDYGSVWVADYTEMHEPDATTGSYDCNEAWCRRAELRKV